MTHIRYMKTFSEYTITNQYFSNDTHIAEKLVLVMEQFFVHFPKFHEKLFSLDAV